jgi:glycine/D-amino acid oxidase-like deaminating enzyme
MGLAIAFSESLRGQSVAVIDPLAESQKASWAAAGILVTRGARSFRSAFREFYVRSIEGYPEWIRRIEKASGVTIPYHPQGDFAFFDRGTPEGDRAWHSRLAQLEREKSRDYEILSTPPPQTPSGIQAKDLACIHFPGEAYVNNRLLMGALRTSLEKRGTHFITAEIQSLSADENGARVDWQGGEINANPRSISFSAPR